MATLPSANVRVDARASAIAAGTDLLCMIAPVPLNADVTPRLFVSAQALLDFHGYSPSADYCAMHFDAPSKPVLFVGVPIVTAGAVADEDDTQVDGTSAVTVTGTPLDESNVELTVTRGGTVSTDDIAFDLSADGGRTVRSVRLGTATSYTIPYLGVTINFAAGTLLVDDAYTFRTSAPRGDQVGMQAARLALAAQQKQFRSILLGWDLQDEDDAADLLAEVDAYETANERFTYARANVRDHHPEAVKAALGTLTFAEVGLTGDTVTRSAGSWLTDGFRVGQVVTFSGTVSNNVSGPIAALSATVMTMGDTDLLAEAAVAGAAVGAAESAVAWRTDIDAEFADVTDAPRLVLAAGRARKASPIHGWRLRRPVAWAVTLRDYASDVHIPTWRKADGALDGWDLEDEDGATVEHDERIDGGLLAAGFTCLRTYANGPAGAYVALDLTRAEDASLLSRTHNQAVANVGCAVTHVETENAIGEVLVLRAGGLATEGSLKEIEARVNSALAMALLQSKGGNPPRASGAVWTASRSDVLNVPGAELNGVLALEINGTLEHINTVVRIRSAG